MPTAGAIVPPQITPLRKPVVGQPSTHIDTATYIELDTETLGCKIYFSTDGTKPNPFKLKEAGRETTFKYRGPFTLKSGKRTLKVIAISRDELHESNIVTKAFIVDDVGPPSDDIDSLYNDEKDEDENGLLVPTQSLKRPFTANKKKTPLRNSVKLNRASLPTSIKKAWGDTTPSNEANILANSFFDPACGATTTNNAVNLPDGPFNPTNYSGTQLNFWGVAPPGGVPLPSSNGWTAPYGNPAHIGPMTGNMLASLEKPTVSVADLKRWMDQTMRQGKPQVQSPPPPQPQPAIQYKTEPELKPQSPGNGDWKGQLEHIYAHLLDHCKKDMSFRTSVGRPHLGKILHADFDEEDTAFLLTVSIAKAGVTQPAKTMNKAVLAKTAVSRMKERTKPKEPPKEKPKEKLQPKPKETVKEKPREEAYFETEEYEQEGTLKAWPAFDAERDCEKLRAAMKGMGTDDKALIDVLGYRSCSQRQEVVIMFKTMFGKDLSKEAGGETSGNFKDLLEGLCLAPPAYDASEVNRSIKGLGTDEDALIEILCTRTNAQIKAMKVAYKKLYGKEMEKDVKGDTSGFFKRLLVAQINAGRDENPTFDRTAAKRDAKAIYEAGEKKWGTDESVFNAILCQRSFPHLRAVFEEYKSFSKKDIDDVIKSEFSGDIKNGLLTVVRCIRYKPNYFARKLQKAMKGLGTDDQAVVRIAVSRCESDMVQIKKSFQEQFKTSLADWIKDDMSGDYSEMLLALIGEREIPAPSAEEIEEAQEEQEMEEVEEEKIEEEGTLKPVDPFDPKKDCEVLKKAMKGFGTDEEAIINVLAKRSNEQRIEIVNMYKTMFGKDLKKELHGEISGSFRLAILGLCQTPAEFDANELRKAMKGLGTDEDCLTEIICTRSSKQMAEIVKTYQQLHNRKLEEDIISETSGHLKRLLVSMVQANRPEGNMVNRTKARKDAKALYGAGADKFGTDESRFNVIICSRSYPQLRATFEEYQKAYGTDIEKVINSEMSGDLREGMLTIVRCLRNKAEQFAKRLYDCMQGLGTDDDTLVRIVVSRCEVDMVQIKQLFQKNYTQDLGAYIKEDISGDYRKTILNLVGEARYIKK